MKVSFTDLFKEWKKKQRINKTNDNFKVIKVFVSENTEIKEKETLNSFKRLMIMTREEFNEREGEQNNAHFLINEDERFLAFAIERIENENRIDPPPESMGVDSKVKQN